MERELDQLRDRVAAEQRERRREASLRVRRIARGPRRSEDRPGIRWTQVIKPGEAALQNLKQGPTPKVSH